MNPEVMIRNHKPGDLNVLLCLMDEEGWNVSLIDLKAGLEVDSNGLLVAEDKAGSPIGCIGLFNILPGITFVTNFVVKKDLRGQGIGKQLWSAMRNATKSRNLVLDSVANMKDWYKTQGFRYEAFCTKFCKGTLTSKENMTDNSTYDIVPLADDMWPALIAYDMQIYPCNRENALRAWFRGKDRYSIIALYNGNVVGYANIHLKSEKEWNIRALSGDDRTVADALFGNLLQTIPVGTEVTFYLVEGKEMPKSCTAFQGLGTTHRLYTTEFLDIQTERIFFSTVLMV